MAARSGGPSSGGALVLLVLGAVAAGPAGGAERAARPTAAAPVRVAVATNFAETCRVLADLFARETGAAVRVSPGSSGRLYAQIANGAPLDVFLSADAERPRRLEAAGQAVAGTRFTYAVGRLALWSPDPRLPAGPETLASSGFRHLAIANPELAPYGAAAREVLRRLGLWKRLEPRLVRGEDVGQAYQFVATGNAEIGFVALSQLVAPGAAAGSAPGSRWLVPDELYASLDQQAVLLLAGRDSAAARAFLDFLKGDAARARIEAAGYRAPRTAP